jgi:hypothetical protein
MTLALIAGILLIISGILWKVFSTDTVQETTEQEPEVATKAPSLVVEEPKEEPKVESPEQVEKRLQKMKNPDEGKPFAKISTPDVSEMPSEEVKPKKKKRYYKKRAPKKPGTDNTAV